MKLLMIFPYESDEPLINMLFAIILNGLSGLRNEKVEIVLERLDILQIRSVYIGEAWELLIHHNVGVLVVH